MTLQIKDWAKFQHFKDRTPPWVKLYRTLLDDIEWHKLDGVSAKYLVMLWLIAAETDHGTLPGIEEIAFRLRTDIKTISKLIPKLSHWIVDVDITAISKVRSKVPGEKETEEETETEEEREAMLLSHFLPRHRETAKTKRPDLNAERTWLTFCGYYEPEKRNHTNWVNWLARETGGADKPPSVHDVDSRASIEAVGMSMGLGKWDEMKERWETYAKRVKGVPA